ncbi:50S ribosomal protein L13 [candidate division WOR_3 bacterium SM23_60]|uniref:Large ribosomal subunit protein uL13 n=1 Tax=candidate division WOR_3 bacterium SM23_60 TaxID=1703780 RepID=A0A0S8GL75_UNCW3|nr:MAG: 50S ribosomal protein L13 [candidate division WOR_3 bacterium SM23_60]
MVTKVLKKGEVVRRWYVVDASDKVLGRLATRISRILIGKHKPQYTPHVDCGDFVVVVNADKFRVTGKKMKDKIYYSHSFYPGGLKRISLELLLRKQPEKVLYHAVSGMLPKNRLRAPRMKRLKLYTAPDHPHTAQKPSLIDLSKM